MFKRAQRSAAYIKVAITGPAGAGKTYGALMLAQGLGKKIAFLDTENRSGSLYADLCEFDTADLEPPFTTKKYLEVIDGAVANGYDVLVIDSLSHAWAGPGGLLQQKEALDQRNGGNRFANWGPITKLHDELNAKILHAPIHIIACMRSKIEYAQDESKKVTKVGLAPVQRDGMEYEFSIVFDVAIDHTFIASKDRTRLFEQVTGKLRAEHGAKIAEWLASGVPMAEVPARVAVPPTEERKSIWAARADAQGKAPESSGDRSATTPRPAPPAAPQTDAGTMACSRPDCGKSLTKGQHDVSIRAFGQPLCPACQKAQARAAC